MGVFHTVQNIFSPQSLSFAENLGPGVTGSRAPHLPFLCGWFLCVFMGLIVTPHTMYLLLFFMNVFSLSKWVLRTFKAGLSLMTFRVPYISLCSDLYLVSA